jgi:hypothetical protein
LEKDVQTAGRRRKEPSQERIAQRVARFCDRHAPGECPEGVQTLNPGFFALERMRQQTVAGKKQRAKRRGKVRGK